METRMAISDGLIRSSPIVAACLATGLSGLFSQPAAAQQPQVKLSPLTSLIAEGFEIKAAAGTQSGVVSALVLQKDKSVFLCSSKDLSIQPLAFECWPIK
jgi:hypothetical protein